MYIFVASFSVAGAGTRKLRRRGSAFAQAIFGLLHRVGLGKARAWPWNEASYSVRCVLGSPPVDWLASLAMFKRAGLTARLHEGLAAHTPSTGKA